MQARVMRISASVGCWIAASGMFSIVTSCALCITVARMVFGLSSAALVVHLLVPETRAYLSDEALNLAITDFERALTPPPPPPHRTSTLFLLDGPPSRPPLRSLAAVGDEAEGVDQRLDCAGHERDVEVRDRVGGLVIGRGQRPTRNRMCDDALQR